MRKYHIIYSVSPAWVRTDRKDMFIICTQRIHGELGISHGRRGEERRGEERRGEERRGEERRGEVRGR